MCHYTTLWLWIVGDFPGCGKQNHAFATSCYRDMLNKKRIDHVLNTTVYSMTNTVPLIHLVRHRTSLECQRKSLLEDMLCTFQPLAKGDLVNHVLHTLILYKDCLGIMKEQCKNGRLPHLLMIVVHGETLWSPALQPMDDDDDYALLKRGHQPFSHGYLLVGIIVLHVHVLNITPLVMPILLGTSLVTHKCGNWINNAPQPASCGYSDVTLIFSVWKLGFNRYSKLCLLGSLNKFIIYCQNKYNFIFTYHPNIVLKSCIKLS